ncbi:MAG: TolC family protein [Bacteroidales bacterium]|nr:TolC family protein [Bacteroidales bacterium]MBO7305897.1 TolC family protein [Bacteroidales bacterium]
MTRIKLVKLVVAVIGAIVLATPLRAQDTLQLTLDKALEIALSESLTLKVADMEIKKSEYAKKGTYSALFPQIDFSFNYQRSIKKQTMYMGDQSFQIGRNNTWSTGFSAAMPLVNVSLWKSLQITGMNVELAIEKAKSSKEDLIDQVQQAFYTALLAKDSYNVYKENYDNAVRNYEEVKSKYANDRTSKFEVIRSEVTMQNAETSVYDSQNSIILAEWKLKALLGIDLQIPIVCLGNLIDYKETLAEYVDPNASIENNSTIKQLEIQERILEKTYKMQIAKYYPTLNLSLNYQWMAMSENFKFSQYIWSPYSTGAIGITIPIFSGGKRYHDVKQAKVQMEQLALQKEDAIRNLEVGVKQAVNSMETCLKQYNAANKSLEGAQLGYEIALKRYEIGSGTLLELQDSQLALLRSKLTLNQAIYSYMMAKSSLEKVLGTSLSKMEKAQ